MQPKNSLSLATTLLLAATSSTSAASSRPECLHTRGQELARSASCGDDGSIAYCFSQIALDTSTEHLVPQVEECFLNAGCNAAEAPIQAFWALRRCESSPSPADLRRHAIPAAAAAAAAGLAPRQDTNKPAATTPTAAAAVPAATTTDLNASPSPCFTNTDISVTSCPTQSTGADIGKTLSKGCVPTTQPSPVCRDGLICKSDSQGNPSCMYEQNSLGVAGTIIAIFFATAVALSVFGVCFLCCRERRVQKRLERAAEAANIAREAKNSAMVNSRRPVPGVVTDVGTDGQLDEDGAGQPLMQAAQDHPPLPQLPREYSSSSGRGGYNTASGTGTPMDGGHGGQQQNPFADSHDSHPLR
ncbi:hypothetical protein B0H66DRAFT_532751 [Apodospora peruviana]|uniref:Uncharacterized protein n=1 Tax=Apodospora peruviana TaxID=516989 RepID=A0AAE0M405_9PEZI|nr:hypothetical protein B0H66DRAFT_532751 [Apodospora peruviana]